MTQLVIDAGAPRFLGVLSVDDGKYTPYRGESIQAAIERIRSADQVITFNGGRYDLVGRGGFPELENLPTRVVHIDMMVRSWEADTKFFGKGLEEIYVLAFGSLPSFPDTYEGDNERDCYMTLKLFELWEAGKLRAS